MKLKFTASAVMAAALTLTACATSPTGRNQVLLYSESQLAQMGDQAFTGMKEELKISNKAVQNSYVECVANAITAQVPASVFNGQWEVVVFDDEQVNAFALPGGKIGVYTGLLKVAENQHQLAAVIGHEVGHVIAEHGNERMSQSTLINVGSQAVGQVPPVCTEGVFPRGPPAGHQAPPTLGQAPATRHPPSPTPPATCHVPR